MLPADEERSHLIAGKTKNIHPTILVEALLHSDIRYVRVVSFGAKIKVTDFPELCIQECGAVGLGFQPNMFHPRFEIKLEAISEEQTTLKQ